MKFGVCRGLDDFEAMRGAKEAGVDFFETGFGCLVNFDDEKIKESKAVLDSFALPCSAANSFIPGDLKLVGDDVDYGAIEDYLDRGFERVKLFGVEKIVLGSGRARSFEDGFSAEKAKEQMARFLSDYAAPRAKKTNSIILLEPLRFCESSMIYTVADAVELAELSGADNVFALADLYHVYGNNDSVCEMMNFKNKVRHAHVAEPVNRRYPKEGDREEVIYIYREFIKGLEAVGCDTCSVEAHTDDFNGDISAAMKLFKTL